MKKIIIPSIALLGLVYCSTSKKATSDSAALPPMTHTKKELAIAQKTNPTITLVDLNAGRAIYFNQCTQCHKVYDIPKFSERKWKHEIDDMSPKAHLTDAQKTTLSNYILSYREANALVTK